MKTKTLLAALTTAAFVGSANAALITSHVTGSASLSSSDLLHNVAPVAGTMPGSASYVATEASLTNGVASNANAELNWLKTGTASTFGSLEYDLDTSVNTLGYDLSSLALYTGFATTFNTISVEVFTRTVGGSFTSLGTVTSNNTGAAMTTLTITNFEAGGVGVDGIRLDFKDPGANGMLSDIDLFGTATVPEPGSLALMGLGGLCVLRRRRG